MKKTIPKSVLKVIFIVSVISITATAHNAGAQEYTTPYNGEHYYDAMKSSIVEVVEENQQIINKNQDGTTKNKHLRAKNIYRKIYENFTKNIGANFSLESLKGEYDPKRISAILVTQLLSSRIIIAEHQYLFNAEANAAPAIQKKFIPVSFGNQVSAKMQTKTGVSIKQTTLGKGKYKARNPDNEPDAWESTALRQFTSPDWEKHTGMGTVVGTKYRYIKPLYINKSCLICHGSPAGQKGPYGNPKEGYKIGEIRGGISITILLKQDTTQKAAQQAK